MWARTSLRTSTAALKEKTRHKGDRGGQARTNEDSTQCANAGLWLHLLEERMGATSDAPDDLAWTLVVRIGQAPQKVQSPGEWGVVHRNLPPPARCLLFDFVTGKVHI